MSTVMCYNIRHNKVVVKNNNYYEYCEIRVASITGEQSSVWYKVDAAFLYNNPIGKKVLLIRQQNNQCFIVTNTMAASHFDKSSVFPIELDYYPNNYIWSLFRQPTAKETKALKNQNIKILDCICVSIAQNQEAKYGDEINTNTTFAKVMTPDGHIIDHWFKISNKVFYKKETYDYYMFLVYMNNKFILKTTRDFKYIF